MRHWAAFLLVITATVLVSGLSAHPLLAASPIRSAATSPARTSTAAVQPDRGIVISPFLSDIKIQPSDATKDVSVTVTNDTAKQQSFTVSSLDFGSLNDTGGIVFAGSDADTLTQKYGLAAWLQIPNNRLTLAPGKSSVVQAYIQNQASLGPGGHYAALVLATDSADASSGGSVSVKQKISALIFATKVGGEVYDMKLTGVQHDGNRRTLPTIVTLNFKNTGNVHVVPRGTVRLVAPGGHEVSKGIINEASAYVLPERSRQLAVELQSLGGVAWRPGTYHLQVDYRYDGHDSFATRVVSLRYFSLQLGLVLLLAAVLLLYTSYKVLQRTRRHRQSVQTPAE